MAIFFLNPVGSYPDAKVSREMLSKVYSDSYNMNIISTRFFNIYRAVEKTILDMINVMNESERVEVECQSY